MSSPAEPQAVSGSLPVIVSRSTNIGRIMLTEVCTSSLPPASRPRSSLSATASLRSSTT
jgi:hypothetical protein